MTDLLSGLIELLQEQNKNIQRLLELGSVETEALKRNELEKLSEIVGIQESVGASLQSLEQKRKSLQQKLGEYFELQEVTISKLLSYIDADLGQELEEISELLKSNYAKLQEINRTNAFLIQQGLSYVIRAQQVLTPAGQKTYGPGGSQNLENLPNSTLDKSV